VVDAIAADLALLAQAVREIEAEVLQPGSLAAEVRRRIAEKITETLGGDSLLARFVRVLADNDRLAELPGVSDWFAKIRDVTAGRVRAFVTTRRPSRRLM